MSTAQSNTVDVIERAIKTFVQGFVVAWAATNFAITKVALFGAGMAAFSVIWNTTNKVANAVAPYPTPPAS